MKSSATTVAEYLKTLPAERREAISAVRKVILANLPAGYEEVMGYGMIGYVVPHRLYPAGYHCDPSLPLPFANLASQKNHMALYLMMTYCDPALEAWFRAAWRAAGKKLDMGKGCVRFTRVEEVPLEVVGQLMARVPVRQHIARMEQVLAERKGAGKGKPAKVGKAKTGGGHKA
jgi:hypothetical protein